MKKCVYPGSFDPITFGHLDVIHRAAKLFDHVVVAVAQNDQKTPLFTADERVELIKQSVLDLPNVSVTHFEGLLVNFANEEQATAIVRGLRAVSDFEFEFQMALVNRQLSPNLETVFLTPREEYTYLSSRIVKEVSRLGGETDAFLPPHVKAALAQKLGKI